ncbi:MAG TPA: hypothetical protein VGQ83_25575, partial [Polyangia bacterium]
MRDEEMEPLARDAQEVMALGRTGPGVPPDARARVIARVEATVAAAPAGPGDAGTGAGAAGAAGGAHAGATAAAGAGALLAKPLVVGVASFLLGLGGGAALYAGATRGARPPAGARPAVCSPALVPAAPAPTAVPAPASLPAAVPLTAARGPASPLRSASASGRDAQLAAERALIEIARTALSRGDAAGALEPLRAHARGFARGQFVEEREALLVQALAARSLSRIGPAGSAGGLGLGAAPETAEDRGW